MMKLTTFILLISLMQVSAATFGQRLTLKQDNLTIDKVFREIRKQTGYDVLMGYGDFKASKINANFDNASLTEVMDVVVKNTGLTYSIEEKTIVVKRKSSNFLDQIFERLNAIDVSGRVVDAEGRGLPGASVSVKGKGGKAVSTGANGNFYLKGVDEDAVLLISFIGYVPKEVKAVKELGDVVLELSNSKLDEVQVIAYGTTTQRLSTGNVATIKADVIEKQPVNNPLLALQGRVPGLFIEQATGFAGTGVKVRIQGTNSMRNGNDPLYVVDGIPFTAQLLSGSNPILSAVGSGVSSGSPLNFLNPADIESIDVLKDADATAIYGSRAANGAILITTKKGKPGELKVDVNIQNGWGQVSRKLNLMNTPQYLEMRREGMKNDGLITIPFYEYDLNGVYDQVNSKDWQKELIGGTAQYNDFQASVSGGGSATTFLVGANYHKEGNVFPGDFDDNKGAIHFNINSASANQKFRFQLSGSYLKDNNLLPQIDLTSSAMTLAPNSPNLLNVDGSINWLEDASGNVRFNLNPMTYLFGKFQNTTGNLIGNAVVSYQIIPGLNLKSSFGYNNLQSDILSYKTLEGLHPSLVPYSVRSTDFTNNEVSTWSIEPQLEYGTTVGKGKINILIGSTLQKENRDGTSIQATGFTTDQVMEDIRSAKTLLPISSINSVYRYNALFGRVNFNLEDRYIVNLTARRDGSSRFGVKNQFNTFGALAVAWIFSEENLIKNNLPFLSHGKLRGSYGTTGNDGIPDYSVLSLYRTIYNPGVLYQGIIGYEPDGLANPYLEWEETKKLQFGLDFGFLNDKILVNTNYSLNRSSNQLLSYTLSSQTGFGGIEANLPATVQNRGWEISVSSININRENFRWSSSFNITLPKNKLIAFSDSETSEVIKSFYVVNESINMVRGFHFLGVDPATGTYLFSDRNGNPTLNPVAQNPPNGDLISVMNPDPKFYGGFQNTFSYMGFELDVLFQFTKQIARHYKFGNNIPGVSNFGTGNQPEYVLDRWQNAGDIKSIQRYTTGFLLNNSGGNARNSDGNWGDASYIRLKNISLSWELPQKWKNEVRLRNCRLYLQGQNLATITNYLGLDPESKSSLSLPPLRVITFGIRLGI